VRGLIRIKAPEVNYMGADSLNSGNFARSAAADCYLAAARRRNVRNLEYKLHNS